MAIVFGLVLLAVFLANLANTARRLLDCNKSTWWLLVFVGVPAVFGGLQELFTLGGGESAAGPAGLMALIGLGFSVWGLVEIGILKGTEGANRYGDDPLGASMAEVFA